MKSKASKKLTKAQQRYKKYFYQTSNPHPQFEVGQEVYVDKLPTSAAILAQRTAATTRSKLLSKITGPFKTLDATADTVSIDEGGIPNTSTDRATIAPPPAKIPPESLNEP